MLLLQNTARWLDCRNDSGETIPPFSPVRITGVDVSTPGDTFLKVDKPNLDGAMMDYGLGMAFTGIAPIGTGSRKNRGQVTIDAPFIAIANSTPTAGHLCGITNGAWTLSVQKPGFRIVSVIDSETRKILVVPGPVLLKGKTTGTWTKGSAVTIEIYTGAGDGAITSPVVSVSGWNRFADIATGKWAQVEWNGDEWDGVSGECD